MSTTPLVSKKKSIVPVQHTSRPKIPARTHSVIAHKTHPRTGSIHNHHLLKRNPIWHTRLDYQSQAALDRARRTLSYQLPSDHPRKALLDNHTCQTTGILLTPETSYKPAAVIISNSPVHKKGKSSQHARCAKYMLEKNTFREMWNGLMTRAVREEEWCEFDRVKEKMLRMRTTYRFRTYELAGEHEVARLRRRSANRTEMRLRMARRERERGVGGSGRGYDGKGF